MDLFVSFPAPKLTSRMLWEALVDIGEMRPLGQGPLGERRIIPILGGEFRGGAGMEGFHGKILPGGADRQLIRVDGGKELDALYEMEVVDGTVLTIHNKVIIDESGEGARYALSHIQVTAPQGPWSWLNRRIILGSLQPAMPARNSVIIRGYEASVSA
ncbi:MAG: DUF3237 family protein [Maritimibacter sp.]